MTSRQDLKAGTADGDLEAPGQARLALPLVAGDLAEPDEPLEDGDLIEHVRRRLEIDAGVSDVTIAASLAQIATRHDVRARWLAAFASPLGKHLARRGSDLNTAINILLGLAPRQQG